jgi:glycosyltransferase involved in cell wall biosynthesis
MYVSVIIPIYKTPIDWLIMSIKSVLNQTYKDIQLILVDDCSDSSEIDMVCNGFCKKDNRVEYYKLEENKGISYALNFGLSKCKYEWVFRLDSDDIMVNNRIEIQMEYIRRNPNVDILGTSIYVYVFRDNKWSISKLRTTVTHPIVVTKEVARNSNWFINHPSVLYRKSKIDYLGGYDESLRGLPEDYDLWVRALVNNMIIHNLPIPLTIYRATENALSQNFNSNKEDFFIEKKKLLIKK